MRGGLEVRSSAGKFIEKLERRARKAKSLKKKTPPFVPFTESKIGESSTITVYLSDAVPAASDHPKPGSPQSLPYHSQLHVLFILLECSTYTRWCTLVQPRSWRLIVIRESGTHSRSRPTGA